MRFWSKGLGKRSLSMDCGKEVVAIQDRAAVLSGRVRPPLGWTYTITMDGDDWLDFIELTFHPTIIRYLLRKHRRGLALRTAWHMIRLYAAVGRRLLLLRIRPRGSVQVSPACAELSERVERPSSGI